MIVDGLAQWVGGADGVDGLTYSEYDGGNVFIEHLPASPDRAVAIYSRPGPETSSLHPYDEPHAQILIRGEKDVRWVDEMHAKLYSFLHAKRHVELPDGTQLIYLLVVQSSPTHLAPDENGRFRVSMNLRSETYNPTSERPA